MTIYAKVKAVAKRRPLISRMPIEIDASAIVTSNDLISRIVRNNVQNYNNKAIDAPLFPYLTEDAIADKAKSGKIGFGDRKNENVQDEDEAVENALSCFADGIFRMFINDVEVGVNQPISLEEGAEITFIRLTMLTGY